MIQVIVDCTENTVDFPSCVKDILPKTKLEPINVYCACISMVGKSQQYATLLVYHMIKEGILDEKFLVSEVCEQEHIKILIEERKELTPEVGIRAILKTQYRQMLCRNQSVTMVIDTDENVEAYWKKWFELVC